MFLVKVSKKLSIQYLAKKKVINMKAYQKVEKVFRRRNHLTHLQSIASWDHSTMMPAGGNEARAQAMAEASVMQIELMESPELPELFSQAQSETSALNEWQKANLREMKETWLNLTCPISPALRPPPSRIRP